MSTMAAEYRTRRPARPDHGRRAAEAWERALHRAARRRSRHAARAQLRLEAAR